jgi:cysteine-rich repeat protein
VTVTLTWAGPDNTFGTGDDVVLTQTTAADGSYAFTGLVSGSYTVDVDESTAPPGIVLTTADPLAITLVAGGAVADADFGFTGTGSIGDTIFFDDDSDGTRDPGESGLADVSVNLLWAGPDGTFGTSDDVTYSQMTAADGSYVFTHLPAGLYQVDVDESTAPAGTVLTTDNDPLAVTLAPGEDYNGANFGFAPVAPGVCGNGVIDAGEECDDGNTSDGDGCSATCTSELIPGHGCNRSKDCYVEWLVSPTTLANGNPQRAQFLECNDDDPSCDFGAVPGDAACTFRVALCFNLTEQRFSCMARDVATIDLTHHFRKGEDLSSIVAVVTQLGGTPERQCSNRGRRGEPCAVDADCDTTTGSGDGVCTTRRIQFVPPFATPDACTGFAEVQVALKNTSLGLRAGTKSLFIAARPSSPGLNPRGDVDRLRLRCRPPGAGG